MAQLTTVDGVDITFDPGHVVLLNVQALGDGRVATAVYGIAKAPLRIMETPDAFLGRLSIADGFAKLTRPDDSPVWINARAVASLRDPLPVDNPAARAVLTVGTLQQAVKEDRNAAIALLNAHGADL